ncbi:hypothetical protein AMTR_s00041p00064960 [Amborella trichopoda]|uniref:DUF7054 domain-containing protein n=1 Tax=Amborella trichopoda TaxID=13333 RepID=W1Q082_AMBTC|nr:hypothetical protein AMTR_s00041p00064960 [Amborella trichopoda]
MTGSSVSRPASGQGQRKSASFHGRIPESSEAFPAIPRPESHPDLAGRRKLISGKHQHLIPNSQDNVSGRLTKLLLNVTVQRSLGHVHVVMSPENTVDDLIKAAINAYVKEGRRPLLSQVDPSCYELHYSQFSLESKLPKP